MNRFALIPLLAATLAAPATASAANHPHPTHGIGSAVLKYNLRGGHATLKLAPPIQCTMANRLDVFVDEDNIMWACECEALKTMHICHWQVIGGVESTEARKYLRRHHIILRHGPRGWSYTIKPMYIRIAA